MAENIRETMEQIQQADKERRVEDKLSRTSLAEDTYDRTSWGTTGLRTAVERTKWRRVISGLKNNGLP